MVIPIQWRPKYIEGYEGEYGAVRAGFVFSFKRWKFLKGSTDKDGYLLVNLCKHGEKLKTYKVHRLVAQTFIPNPNNLPEVNHLDEDKQNNAVWNLQWVTHKENTNYGTHNERMSASLKGFKHTKETRRKMSISTKGEKNPMYGTKNKTGHKPVLMYSLDGEFIRRFDSVADANEFLGKDRINSNIALCARHLSNTAWNYKWEYEQLEEQV